MSEDQNWTTSVTGTSPEYFAIRSWPVAQRRAPSRSRTSTAATKVVVLGQTVVDKLFGAERRSGRPDGAHQEHPVPGRRRAGEEGAVADGAGLRRRRVHPVDDLPDARSRAACRSTSPGTIIVERDARPTTPRAPRRRSRSLLRDRHHIAAGADDDFSIRNLTEMANAQQEGTKTLTTLLASHRRRLAARGRHRHHEHHAVSASPSGRARSACAWRSAPSRATSSRSSSSRR